MLFRSAGPLSPFDLCRAVLARIFIDLRLYRQQSLVLLQDNVKLRRELKLLDKNTSCALSVLSSCSVLFAPAGASVTRSD